MRLVTSKAPQLCHICNGEFGYRDVRVIQGYTFCISCIEMATMEKFGRSE